MERTTGFTKSGLVWLVVINIILFQNPLLRVTSLFKYTDECLMLFFAAWIATHGKKLHKSYVAIAVLELLLIYLGLLGNSFSGISRPGAAVILDIANFAKLFVTLIGAALYFEEIDVDKRGLLRLIAHEVRLIVTAGAALAVLSQVADLGMTHGERLGIKAFQYFFSTPGMLNQYCIIYLLILTLDLTGSEDKRFKYPFLLITFVLWLSTGRTRGIALLAVWTIVMLLANNASFADRNIPASDKVRRFLKLRYLLAAAAGLVLAARRRVCHVRDGTGGKILLAAVLPLRPEHVLGAERGRNGADRLLLARSGRAVRCFRPAHHGGAGRSSERVADQAFRDR